MTGLIGRNDTYDMFTFYVAYAKTVIVRVEVVPAAINSDGTPLSRRGRRPVAWLTLCARCHTAHFDAF